MLAWCIRVVYGTERESLPLTADSSHLSSKHKHRIEPMSRKGTPNNSRARTSKKISGRRVKSRTQSLSNQCINTKGGGGMDRFALLVVSASGLLAMGLLSLI